jgi:hypothetical protein
MKLLVLLKEMERALDNMRNHGAWTSFETK